MSEKLLIVEDDKKLNDGIRLALKNDAYFFYQCRTLQEAREILKKEDITLVLLDVNLPDGNGIDFVREIRKQKEVIQKLISDIAHQTLTPISNLKVYGEILSEVSNENQEEIATILEQTEKLDFLIQSLVKLSRMESGIIAVHSEDTTIAQMFASVQQQFNVKVREKNITLSLCDTDLHVRCDPKWTVEALGNIVDNAIKYTACGGNVQVKAEQNSFFVKIDIIDDGIGIEKEEIPKIFGRFYRSLSVADQPGVGIGLFLAREIIQAQKGYIKVTSKRGKGSTFSVFLPIAKKE